MSDVDVSDLTLEQQIDLYRAEVIRLRAATAAPRDVTVSMADLFDPARMPERGDEGVWHPDISLRCLYDANPDDEAPISNECLASLGWELRIVTLDDDGDSDTYYERGQQWQPEAPGPEWRLGCVTQDGDGDWNAWWFRRIAALTTPPSAVKTGEGAGS